MLLGLISDTHDRLPTFRAAIELFARLKVDAIFHAGDFIAPFAAKLMAPQQIEIPVYAVFGNNDGERAGLKKVLPQVIDGPLHIELGGCRIVMHHFIDWVKQEDLATAEIVITGHTHEASVRSLDDKLLVNPGECCGWVNGKCTAAVLDVASREVTFHEFFA